LRFSFNQLTDSCSPRRRRVDFPSRKYNRTVLPSARNIRLHLLLTRSNPRVVMLLGDLNAVVPKQHGDPLNRHPSEQQLYSESVA
jgi:hypothetical protein